MQPARPLRAAIIGAGRRGPDRGSKYGIAEAHANAYRASGRVEVVAAADIAEAPLAAFCKDHHIPRGYSDYRSMLAYEQPDIVSICTWPQQHKEMVLSAASLKVKGVLCEKPIALTLADADQMISACRASGTQLCVNHQRRLGAPFRAAKEIVAAGEIGALLRIESMFRHGSLYDSGTHWVDLMFFLLDDIPAVWVMAQVDCFDGPIERGRRVEAHSISQIEFGNGTRGYLEGGRAIAGQVPMRLLGTDGVLEVLSPDNWPNGESVRGITKLSQTWRTFAAGESIHANINYLRAVQDLLDAVELGVRPALEARVARATTEVLVAAYESALRRRRIELPITVDYDPLERLTRLAE